MQDVNCYHCGAAETTDYAAENGFKLVKCGRCGLLFVNPRPGEGEIQQATVLGVHQGAASLEVTGRFSHAKVRRYARILKDLLGDDLPAQAISWLDIGCGHGEFLQALQIFGRGRIGAQGIEPNEAKRRGAQARGLAVIADGIEGVEGPYDRISLLNVYSHLPDPPAFIAGLRRLLSDGGELVLETGDTANFSSQDHYRPFYLPDHLSFASEEIVRGILRRAGFEIVAVRKYPVMPLDAISVLKEIIKLAMPGRQSRLKYLLRSRAQNNTDMYIKARLRG